MNSVTKTLSICVVATIGTLLWFASAPSVLADSDHVTTASGTVPSVRAELESMFDLDQSGRNELIELEKTHTEESPEVRAFWTKQSALDRQNVRRLEEIVLKSGWPKKSIYGWKASLTAFLIVQHASLDIQQKYLPVLRDAAQAGELDRSQLALLEDRVRIRTGQKQIYGSQVRKTEAGEWEPLPLEDEENVDRVRSSVGLGTLSDYLQGFAERSGGKVIAKWSKTKPNGSTSTH